MKLLESLLLSLFFWFGHVILQTCFTPGFHARYPPRHQHPQHALQDEQADFDVQRHLSLRDPASRWRIPQQLSSLTGNLEYHVVNN